jgi:drug/metabolite transporter (DMT)-like permease
LPGTARDLVFWRTRRLALQLLSSSMLLIATFCFFGALRYLPLAEASAITFLAPIFIVLLSGPLLGERPTRPRWVASPMPHGSASESTTAPTSAM